MKLLSFFKTKTTYIVFSVLISMSSQGSAQIQSSNTGKSDLNSMGIEPMKPREPLNAPPKSSSSSVAPMTMPSAPSIGAANYFYPGLIVRRGGGWQGGDNLLNLSPNIGIYFNISKPENDMFEINEEKLKLECRDLFEKAGINPRIMIDKEGQPPLPFFQVQILIYPIKDGYVAACEGRLFESVVLKRIEMDTNMAFQGVTWQKSTLIVGPTGKFPDQLHSTVEDIVKSFADVYQAFSKK